MVVHCWPQQLWNLDLIFQNCFEMGGLSKVQEKAGLLLKS
jgi:hypothetical protein